MKHNDTSKNIILIDRFGDEWKKELLRMTKQEIVDMYARSMQFKKTIPGGSLMESHDHILGLVNDFETGVIDKSDFMVELGEYTKRIMDIFWTEAKKKIRNNPDLLDQ